MASTQESRVGSASRGSADLIVSAPQPNIADDHHMDSTNASTLIEQQPKVPNRKISLKFPMFFKQTSKTGIGSPIILAHTELIPVETTNEVMETEAEARRSYSTDASVHRKGPISNFIRNDPDEIDWYQGMRSFSLCRSPHVEFLKVISADYVEGGPIVEDLYDSIHVKDPVATSIADNSGDESIYSDSKLYSANELLEGFPSYRSDPREADPGLDAPEEYSGEYLSKSERRSWLPSPDLLPTWDIMQECAQVEIRDKFGVLKTLEAVQQGQLCMMYFVQHPFCPQVCPSILPAPSYTHDGE